MNGQLYVVPELTTTFQQWTQKPNKFISQFILPEVPVDNERFYVWSGGKEHLTIPSNTLRSGRSKFSESTFSRSYAEKGPLQEHGLSAFITDRQYKLGGSSLSVENQVVESLASQMRLLDEKDVADTLSNTSIVTNYTTKSGTGQWSDYANSNPFNDITTGVLALNAVSPMPVNTAWTSIEVWLQLINHPDFLDRIKWSKTGVMSEADFLTLLAPYGITKLHIGNSKYNTATEGQTASLSSVWGKHFWIGYVTDEPGQQEINGGYKFSLRDSRKVFKETRMNPAGAEIVNGEFYDHILLSADVYYLIQNAVA